MLLPIMPSVNFAPLFTIFKRGFVLAVDTELAKYQTVTMSAVLTKLERSNLKNLNRVNKL